MSKADIDNRANQLNPNNDAYYQSRGYDGRPGDDDCDDGYYGGFNWRNCTPVQEPSETQRDLAAMANSARQEHERKCRIHPGLGLCDFLMKMHPYFVYKHMGHESAVIVHVLGCEKDSQDASTIKLLADAWRKLFSSQDSLTVFRVEFEAEVKPCIDDRDREEGRFQ